MTLELALSLVLIFFKISIFSFGGIFSSWAMAEASLTTPDVAARGILITPDDIGRIFSLSQILPGPMASGMTMLGYKPGGIVAMFCIYLGLLLPGLILVPLLTLIFRRLAHFEYVQAFRKGAVVAVIAILAVFFLNLMRRGLSGDLQKSLTFLAIFAGVFLINRKYPISPVIFIGIGGLIGYLFL